MLHRHLVGALIAVVAIFALSGLALAQEDAASLIKKGDDLYLARSGSLDSVKKAIEVWEKASALDPKSEEPLYKISMGYYYLGRFTDQKNDELTLFTKGKEYGEKAVALNPNSSPSQYWVAVNIGKWGEAKGIMKSLSMVKPMRDHLEKAEKADPRYFFGGPARVLGRLYFKAPSVISIGDKKKAEEYLRKSLQLSPDYSLTMLYLAEVLADSGKKDEAKTLCEKIQSLSPMPGFERELANDKAEARKLQEKIH